VQMWLQLLRGKQLSNSLKQLLSDFSNSQLCP
jgi:hypothetical protein